MKNRCRLIRCIWLLALFPVLSGALEPVTDTPAIDLRNVSSLASVLPELSKQRLVFVGEIHDKYSHHLVQLAIIRALHRAHPNLAIGLEFFQQPFQDVLDDYVSGRIDEKTMLRRTEYFDRWRFDYRLYRPILSYAREQRIPLVALNVPTELINKVAELGIAGLSEEQQARLPQINRDDAPYRERLREVFEAHSHRPGGNFEHFLEAQLLWDEGMAERAAGYLKENPNRPMVILAGAGHLVYGSGIPDRIERRTNIRGTIVLNEPAEPMTPDLADFVLLPKPETLPQKGLLGIYMEPGEKGVRVERFAEKSPAEAAGLRVGDQIIEIDGEPVSEPVDVQLTLIDHKPDEVVELTVLRSGLITDETRRFRFELQ